MIPNWGWDALTLLLVAVCAISSYRCGFTRSLVGLIGTAAAFAAAMILSAPVAEMVYDKLLAEGIISALRIGIEQYGLESVELIVEKLDVLLAQLPSLLANIVGTELSPAALEGWYREFISQNSGDIAMGLADEVIAPIIKGMLRILSLCLIFIACSMIIKLVARMLGIMRYVPLIGPIDRLLGGVFGVLRGMLYVFVVASVVWLLISMTNDGLGFVTRGSIAETTLFCRFFDAVVSIGASA